MSKRLTHARRAIAVFGVLGVAGLSMVIGTVAHASPLTGPPPSASPIVAAADPTSTSVPVVTPPPTVDPTPVPAPTPPVPDPTATADPTPAPVPTTDPIPTDQPVPTDSPAPVVTADPVATPEPTSTDSGAIVPVDTTPSDSGSASPTPTPTVTPTPQPAPSPTATAAALPPIELPFYPPPSAGVAHDAFPFLLAGIAGGLVLLVGFGSYLFARWRVRRLRFKPLYSARIRQPFGLGAFGHDAAAFNSEYFSMGLVVSPSGAGPGVDASTAARSPFELGLPAVSAAENSELVQAYSVPFGSPLAKDERSGRSASAFLLGWVPRRSASPSASAASLTVFEPVAEAPKAKPDTELGFSRSTSPKKIQNFDLGFSAP